MDNIDLDALSLFQRLKAESPKWAKRVFNACISAAGVASALVLAKATHIFDDVFPHLFWTLCHYTIASGVAAGAVAKNTVDGAKLAAKQDATQQAQAAVNTAGVTAGQALADNAPLSVEVEIPVSPEQVADADGIVKTPVEGNSLNTPSADAQPQS